MVNRSLLLAAVLVAACNAPSTTPPDDTAVDSGTSDAVADVPVDSPEDRTTPADIPNDTTAVADVPADLPVVDARTQDTGPTPVTDSGSTDTGPTPVTDSGSTDTGPTPVTDSGSTDTGPAPMTDAGSTDTGPVIADTSRVLRFRNECATTAVRVGSTGGFVRDCGPGGSCPAGTACSAARVPPGCFWVLPAPSSGTRDLAPGESVTYVINTPAINHIQWSGNVYGSTQCSGANCATGRCPGGVCNPGVGPEGPTTRGEFTFLDNTVDYYDISLIDGVNVPMSMGVDPSGRYRAAPSGPNGAYWCGTGGASTASHPTLTSCSWSFNPTNVAGADRSNLLRYVMPSDRACTTDTDCAGVGVCGTIIAPGTARAERRCGAQVGWWTANQLCSETAGTLGAPLDCGGVVSGPGGGRRNNLFACSGPYSQSCYSAGATSTCCGCAVWPGYPVTSTCQSQNPDWNSTVLPWVTFAKSACPTAYSYQYDDPSSTFVCRSEGDLNGTDYVITFCPGGRRGF